MRKHNAQRGFTLMELMVVIVIVAILAAVAVPLYLNYVNDARRTEARGAIGAIITAQQTWRQQHETYTDDTFVQNPAPGTQNLNCDLTEALANWVIEIESPTGDGFTVTATGRTGTPMADAGTVTMTYSRTTGAVFSP